MNKFRNGLAVLAGIVIIGQLMLLDYDDLSLRENSGSYLGILSMLLLLVLLAISIKNENKTKN